MFSFNKHCYIYESNPLKIYFENKQKIENWTKLIDEIFIMITDIEIIREPLSGEYNERVYDIYSVWNSECWTWVKFTNNDGYQWVGSFRGKAIDLALSKKNLIILVLTSDYLFQLDIFSGERMKYVEHNNYYQNLTITPLQDFIISDYTSIYKIDVDINEKIELVIPESISLIDYLKLKEWNGNKLEFTCEEPTSENCYLCSMEYNCITNTITLLKKSIL